jgi:broad specificity phosphatase PhoE
VTKVLLIRHGSPAAGLSDPELTPLGCEQSVRSAQSILELIMSESYTDVGIIHSPKRRTTQTAEIIRKHLTDHLILDIDLGIAAHPDLLPDHPERTRNLLQQLHGEFSDALIIAVTHGSLIERVNKPEISNREMTYPQYCGGRFFDITSDSIGNPHQIFDRPRFYAGR